MHSYAEQDEIADLFDKFNSVPLFDMDKERTYLNTIFHIRDGFAFFDKMSDKLGMGTSN